MLPPIGMFVFGIVIPARFLTDDLPLMYFIPRIGWFMRFAPARSSTTTTSFLSCWSGIVSVMSTMSSGVTTSSTKSVLSRQVSSKNAQCSLTFTLPKYCMNISSESFIVMSVISAAAKLPWSITRLPCAAAGIVLISNSTTRIESCFFIVSPLTQNPFFLAKLFEYQYIKFPNRYF